MSIADVVGAAGGGLMPGASRGSDVLERASEGLTPTPGTIAIGVLGALSVHAGGEPVVVRRGLPRVLMCSLVIDRGRPVSAEALIDRLWADRLPSHPLNALQTQMAYVRRVLGGAAVAPIATVPSGYVLDRVEVDVDTFEAELGRARDRDDSVPPGESLLLQALTAYDSALALWRGSPFSDVAGLEFADAEIVRLDELRLSACEERCDVLLALGRSSEAVADLSALINDHPLRERAQELLILALYRSGRQADALRAYDRARRQLVDELGIEPDARLRSMEQRVLDHDPTLDWMPLRVTVPSPSPSPSSPVPPPPANRGEPDWVPIGAVGSDRSLGGTRGQLIGRDLEVARVQQLIGERRLVTLTGPGGAGKTRLALEVAAMDQIRRIHLIDLASIDATSGSGEHGGRRGDHDRHGRSVDPRLGNLIASAVGVHVAADGDPIESVIVDIGSVATLVVLDTCEHVLDEVRPLVARLLDACPGLLVLATSRRPLGLPDELAWPVPPLDVPTADRDPRQAASFELFVRRATAVDPDFTIGPDDVDDVAELCRSLDGLPLAIELAAAQMDVMSPSAVRTQLAERRSFASRADGPDRHRTLDATTAWSVELLDECERDMLHRLAVFAPTFDLDAAVAVAGSGDETSIDCFVSLVRNSLVVHERDDRYRLLDTVRAHLVSTEADPGRRAETARRHAEYYAGLASRSFYAVRGPQQIAWMRRLRDDRPNLLVALTWCFGPEGDEQLGARFAGNIAWVWMLQGNMLDSRAALEQGRGVDAPPLVRARLLVGIGLMAGPLGDHERVKVVCTESAELGRSEGDDETIAVALLTLGVAQWATGDFEAAEASHAEAVELFTRTGDVWSRTACSALRARTACDAGDLAAAESLLAATIDDAKQIADDHLIGLTYEQMARVAMARGRDDRALPAAEASLRHYEAIDYAEGMSGALTLAASVECSRGDTVRARRLVTRAMSLASKIGHIGAMCATLECAAAIEVADGDAARAASLLLVAARARSRHVLPLSPAAAERLRHQLDLLRVQLDGDWDDVTTNASMTSLAEAVHSILDATATTIERDRERSGEIRGD